MIVCPVCEHQQAQGLECDVCGKDLSALGGLGSLPGLDGLDGLDGLGPPPPSGGDQVPGLEATVSERVGDVPVERDPSLEASSFDVGDVQVDKVPDLEIASGMVGDVPVEPMPDLAMDRVPDDGIRTPAVSEGSITCRYCRNVQASGMICDKCGMKLPRASATQIAEIRKPAAQGIRCRYCGCPNTTADERCKECGRPLPTGD
ncbi:MAG: hypothetical protein QM723_01200 [Myxococcaceae bacterium]